MFPIMTTFGLPFVNPNIGSLNENMIGAHLIIIADGYTRIHAKHFTWTDAKEIKQLLTL